MSRRLQENIVVLVFLALFASIIVVSLGYGPRARMVPLPIAAFGILLALGQLAWQNLRSESELQIDMLQFLTGRSDAAEDVPDRQPAPVAEKPAGSQFSREVRVTALVAAIVVAFLFAGALPTSFVLCAGYFGVSRQYGWLRATLTALVFTVVIWLLFGQVLGIPIERSLLGPMLARAF
jgi:hypothetical protein